MLSHLLAELILARAAKTARGRRWLEQQVRQAQHRLGIGAGSNVQASGEQAVVDLLRQGAGEAGELCVFDVGSNQGQFLRLLIDGLAGCDFRVHCFEPSPVAFAGLRSHAAGLPNVALNPFGLGKVAGEFDLYSDVPGSGLASLSKRRLDHLGMPFGQRERIRLETLEAYCRANSIGRIDLLKIDVEGHELDVLEGGARLFAERRVRMVSFEFGGCNIDSRSFVQDFFYFFTAHGMRAMYRILPSGELHPIAGYTETLEQFRTTNFLVLLGDSVPLVTTP